ncbi:MAG: hypothetical protein ACI90V_010009 [Bacillariaceae sp.]|jgi:hypothetical protein
MLAPDGNLLIYNEKNGTGILKERIFQTDGSFAMASSAHRLKNGDYLVGSVFVPAATRIRLVSSSTAEEEAEEEGKNDEAVKEIVDDDSSLSSSAKSISRWCWRTAATIAFAAGVKIPFLFVS